MNLRDSGWQLPLYRVFNACLRALAAATAIALAALVLDRDSNPSHPLAALVAGSLVLAALRFARVLYVLDRVVVVVATTLRRPPGG